MHKIFTITSAILIANSVKAQVVPNLPPVHDSALYNILNYSLLPGTQVTQGEVYTVIYRHVLSPSYQMRKLYSDSAQTKPLSKAFYLDGKLHGPFESYQMTGLQAKGRYVDGKLHGERLTYHAGNVVMEKAYFTNGVRSGIWEYYDFQSRLKRKVTYGLNGQIIQEQQF